jgi:predicted amidohydrolase YtcJ
MPFLAGLAAALIAAAFPAGADPSQETAADLVLINGNVHTPSGWAQALAIRGGVIIAVGDEAAIGRTRGPRTDVLDLNGGTVLPGLHDMHVHPLFAGLEQTSCYFEPGTPPEAIAETVRRCVSGAEPGAWILGGNWVAAVFAPGQQTRTFLDAIAPDHPVVLDDQAHHSLWVNSRALERAGITRETPDPPGGIIERDDLGEPTGLLRESAVQLIQKATPPPTAERLREALLLASRIMLSFGITSYTDAIVTPAGIGVMSSLSEEGLLKQRVRACIPWSPDSSWAPGPDPLGAGGAELIARRAQYARPKLAVDCVKIFMDGVPTESRTAAMLEPYHGAEDGARGMMLVRQDTLEKAVIDFDRQGLHIKFHAVGDGAVRAAIDAVQAAREANGWGGPMHEIGHGSFVSPADIPRVRELNMSWEFSPYIWFPTPITDHDVRKAVGDVRMERFTPIRDALETGALIVAGSDWSVVPSVSPWLGIETMITRQVPGGGPRVLAGGQRVPLGAAFRMFTENAARLMNHRDRVGSIEPGMLADLVVTDRNPFAVPVTEIHNTKVRMTFIGGELVHDAAAPVH